MAQKSVLPKRNKVATDSIAKPQLTSLLDVMTILLVFLIQNFSTSGNLIAVPKDLDLATSQSKSAPAKAMTIEVGLHHIAVDGDRMSVEGLAQTTGEPWIPALLAQLEKAQAKIPHGIDPKTVMIQCDKGVDFAILKRVLATCSKANVEHFTLLVKGES